MKIAFVINEPIQNVSGGYKMVYTYANELVLSGDEVTIFYHCRKQILLSNYKLPYWIKCLIAKILAKRGPSWFKLDKKVKRKIVKIIDDQSICDNDIIIATAADTCTGVYNLDKAKGKKVYFIQGYEDWVMDENELIQTYNYRMTKITVSNWLKRIVEKHSYDHVYCVLNGIQKDIFKIKISPEERQGQTICMLYHNLESKGSMEGLDVIIRLKKRYSQLKAYLFGVVDKPQNLPDWIEYTHNASPEHLSTIYNNSMIYLCPSWNEGFGLTGAESMMSGCVLVSTATDGAKEYASNDTAILLEIHDTEQMYEKCCELFENDQMRITMATKGAKSVTKLLDYKKSVDSFINIVHQIQE